MTEMYKVFRGQFSSALSSNVIPTLALTHISANVERENATNTAIEDPSSHTEGETDASKKEKPDANIKFIGSSTQPSITQRKKNSRKKKAAEEARILAISKLGVIKVVQEEAKKIGLDPKKIASAKAGEKFKKAQDAEHQVLKREHSQKVKRLTEINKKRAEQYMWPMTNRIKPEPITDVKIHPNTKPDVLSVYRNSDKRNFDVHNPFKFIDFGITDLDELGPIIQKKKNFIVKDFMTSLSKRYERLKKIPEELRIQSAFPTQVPKQASSQTSGRKRKHMKLEPEVKVHGLECDRSLPEGVSFVNNMVIEEPEYGIFFTDVFGDHAF
ncbi:hypothetical protein Tco_1064770 [Tanacetum coccineum]